MEGNMESWQAIPEKVSLSEYYKKYASPSFYKSIKYISWALYGVAAVNAVPLIFMAFNILMWADVVLVGAMGIALQLHKKASTARALLVYAILNLLGAFALPLDGFLETVLLGIAIAAMKTFHDAKKEYKRLKKAAAANPKRSIQSSEL